MGPSDCVSSPSPSMASNTPSAPLLQGKTVGVHGTLPTSLVAGVTALRTAQKVVDLHTLGQGEGSALQGRDEGKQTAGGC